MDDHWVLGLTGDWLPFEVAWRAHNGHAQVWADAHRNHVFGNRLTKSHAGVEVPPRYW